MENGTLIAEFEKNRMEKVRVELGNYRGTDILNVRVYYDPSGIGKEWRPTKKGIAMSTKLVPQLKDAIDKASKSLGNKKNNEETE